MTDPAADRDPLAEVDTTPIQTEYGYIYPCPNCGQDSGGPEGAACADCWNEAQ